MTVTKAAEILVRKSAGQKPVRSTDWLGRNSWRHLGGSVWEHSTGMRIHTYGLAVTAERTQHWFQHDWNVYRLSLALSGYNHRRAVMAWALSLLRPNIGLDRNV